VTAALEKSVAKLRVANAQLRCQLSAARRRVRYLERQKRDRDGAALEYAMESRAHEQAASRVVNQPAAGPSRMLHLVLRGPSAA
jgi:hypothetical protein